MRKKRTTERSKLMAMLAENETVIYHTYHRRSGAAVISSLPKKLRRRVELRVLTP